jgi:hypothetical protein
MELNRTSEANEESDSMTWRLALTTDRGGHVHLGAVLTGAQAPVYVDLLSTLGAASAADLDLDQLVVLATPEHIADLRRVAEQCIDDARLRNRIVELTDLSAAVMAATT